MSLTTSGSRRSDTAVKPDRSANSTVTVRRSSAAGAAGGAAGRDATDVGGGAPGAPATAFPQPMQKRAVAGTGSPHAAHTAGMAVPQPMQNRAPLGFSVPHPAHMLAPATC